MIAIVIGSLWFLCGGSISLILFAKFIISVRKGDIKIQLNWRKIGFFAGLMITAQVVPTIMMENPNFSQFSYLWPIAYTFNLLVIMLLLRLFGVHYSKAERLFFLFPVVPGIIFWIVQKESTCLKG